jgi:hypothetical protein
MVFVSKWRKGPSEGDGVEEAVSSGSRWPGPTSWRIMLIISTASLEHRWVLNINVPIGLDLPHIGNEFIILERKRTITAYTS